MTDIDINLRIRHFLNVALGHINGKNYDGAIENLHAAEVLDPENPVTLFNLGVTYCKMAHYIEAIDCLTRLINLPRTSVDIITVLKLVSFSLIKLESYEQALLHAGEGLRLTPDDTTLLNIAGYCYDRLGRPDEAISQFVRIIEIDGANANAHNSLAYLIARSDGNLSEALNHAKIALDIKPGNPAYLDTMGFVHLKKGNTDLSKKFLKKALSHMPESREIKNHINMLLKIGE